MSGGDLPAPLVDPKWGRYRKDLTFGRAKGNTWDYQSRTRRGRKRLGKCYYPGQVDIEARGGLEDLSRKIGRLGVGLKANVEFWEDPQEVGGSQTPYDRDYGGYV